MASIHPMHDFVCSRCRAAAESVARLLLPFILLISHLICRRNFYCNTFFHASNKSEADCVSSRVRYCISPAVRHVRRNKKSKTRHNVGKTRSDRRYVANFSTLYSEVISGFEHFVRCLFVRRYIPSNSFPQPLHHPNESSFRIQRSQRLANAKTRATESANELCVRFFMMRLKIMKRNLYSLLLLLKWKTKKWDGAHKTNNGKN